MKADSDEKQFDVLGYKIKFTPEQDDVSGDDIAEEVVDIVRDEAYRIKENSPSLDTAQVSILLALKFAAENLKSKRSYEIGISELQNKAKDALDIIERASL